MSTRQIKAQKDLSISSRSQGRQVTAGNGKSMNEGTNMTLSERFSQIHKKLKEQKKSKKNIPAGKSELTKKGGVSGIKKKGSKGGEKRKTGPSSIRKDRKTGDKKATKTKKTEEELNKELDSFMSNGSSGATESAK